MLLALAYVSAGFLAFPPQVQVGAVSAVQISEKRHEIYVLHRGTPPLAVFSDKGAFLRAWGEGLFKVPHGLRISPDGNLWLTDNQTSEVRKFSPEGKLLLTLDAKLKSPDDLVFDTKGNMYVADAGNARIVKFGADLKQVKTWGKKGKADGEFNLAHSLSIDKQDRIYVGDRGNNRVQVFDSEGGFVRAITGFGNPFGVLAAGDTLFVAEGEKHKLFAYSLDGTMQTSWGSPAELKLPHLMAMSRKGVLYVSEVDGKRVQMFRRMK